MPNGDVTADLLVIGDCHVMGGTNNTYKYKNVNIVVTASKKTVGRLIFDEPGINGTHF